MKYHNKIENCLALNFGMKENIKGLGKGYVKKSVEISTLLLTPAPPQMKKKHDLKWPKTA